MDLEWSELPRTGKATVVGGALVVLGTVLPWMSYSGGSASLLQDGEMEVGVSTGMGSDTATVAPSVTLWIALVLVLVAVGIPLYRGWDWKSALPAFVLGAGTYFVFALSALVLHDGADDGVFVGGERVAESASMGIGLYAALVGTVVISVAGLTYLGIAALAKLRE